MRTSGFVFLLSFSPQNDTLIINDSDECWMMFVCAIMMHYRCKVCSVRIKGKQQHNEVYIVNIWKWLRSQSKHSDPGMSVSHYNDRWRKENKDIINLWLFELLIWACHKIPIQIPCVRCVRQGRHSNKSHGARVQTHACVIPAPDRLAVDRERLQNDSLVQADNSDKISWQLPRKRRCFAWGHLTGPCTHWLHQQYLEEEIKQMLLGYNSPPIVILLWVTQKFALLWIYRFPVANIITTTILCLVSAPTCSLQRRKL